MDKIKIALFDLDGTLLKRPLPEQALKILENEPLIGAPFSDDWDFQKQNQFNHNSLAALKNKYRETNSDEDFGEYSAQIIKTLMFRMRRFSGAEAREVGRRAVERALTYEFSSSLIESLRERGYLLIAVSGSPQFLVDAFVKRYDFDYGIGQKFDMNLDSLVYEAVGQQTWCDKHRIVETFLKMEFSGKHLHQFEIVAVGDTAGDFEMLDLADLAFVINPSSGLLDKISQNWDRSRRLYAINEAKNSAQIANLTDHSFGFAVQNGALSICKSAILFSREAYLDFIEEILDKSENDIQAERTARLSEPEVNCVQSNHRPHPGQMTLF